MEARKEYTGIKLTFEDGGTEADILNHLTGWIVQVNDETDVKILDVTHGVMYVRNAREDGKMYGEEYKIQLDQIHTIHVY